MFHRKSKEGDITYGDKSEVQKELIKVYKKYNILHITKNNTKIKKILRLILKKIFPKFYSKRQAKFKVISEDTINYDSDLLNPKSNLWDGGFS